MPSACAVIGCNSRSNMMKRKLFRFPMLNNSSDKTLAISQARQQEWIKALNREEFFPCHYKNARVCDLHFVFGKSAYYTDVNNVDWVPTLNLGYERPKKPNVPHFNPQVPDVNLDVSADVNSDVPDDNPDEPPFKDKASQTEYWNKSVGSQTDDAVTGVSSEIIPNYQH